jgi:hypothetical protein
LLVGKNKRATTWDCPYISIDDSLSPVEKLNIFWIRSFHRNDNAEDSFVSPLWESVRLAERRGILRDFGRWGAV